MRRPLRAVRRSVSSAARLALERLEAREVPAGLELLAVGADSGPGLVRVLDAATHAERFRINAFDSTFHGGARVAVGDVNGDGVEDIVAASGRGDAPLVRVFSGTDGAKILEITPYGTKFRGGVWIAVGDVNDDGKADVITGRGAGLEAGRQVKVFSGADGSLLQQYDAFDPKFRGGVQVGAGDVNGDGRADVITGSGFGMKAQINVFSGASGKQIQSFNPFGSYFYTGVSVAAGDVNGDGRADIVAASAYGGRLVRVFSGADDSRLGQFWAESAGFMFGLQVSTTHANADGVADIIVSSGGGHVSVRDGKTLSELSHFEAGKRFSQSFVAGAAAAGGDAVLGADAVALAAIRADKTNPPQAARLLAMMSAAMYDAVNGVVGGYQPYLAGLPAAPVGASATAAAAAAAYRILSREMPSQQALFDRYFAAQIAILPNDAARNDGEGYGQTIADKMLAARADDGSTAAVTFTPGSAPGDWVPTPPANAAALLPQWPGVTPFAMTAGDQFRPSAGPPVLDSAQYAREFNEVKALGSATGSTRTADQTQIALFWADGSGTVTPPGHWNQIARDQSIQRGLSLAENARLFAMLNIALADAGIIAWDAKFSSDGSHGRWRPIMAIRNAASDGNSDTAADPAWTPLIATPPFPAYISGHSTFSSAAATVLQGMLGSVSFLTYSDALPDVARTQASFAAAAQEAGMSRIYGGIHYQSDNVDGLAAGAALGQYVLGHELL